MPHAPISPAATRPTPTTASPASAAPLTLEERLTLVNTTMTARLDEAAVAYEVNTSHIPTGSLALADVITHPLDTGPPAPPVLYPTPVAALLQRAHHRLLTGGWCKDALADEDGAHCMLGAIRIQARGDRGLEASAATVLLDAIHRQFGDAAATVPSFNDAHRSGRVPMRMLTHAADLANTHGL
ncbi:hypothetical protein ACIOYT_31980 [Streptomyces halstedii]|uniref:DUF6197 family protein n=1 Tax=Streptomyces halstedii TaxID=1944 RepID=UPI00382141F1